MWEGNLFLYLWLWQIVLSGSCPHWWVSSSTCLYTHSLHHPTSPVFLSHINPPYWRFPCFPLWLCYILFTKSSFCILRTFPNHCSEMHITYSSTPHSTFVLPSSLLCIITLTSPSHKTACCPQVTYFCLTFASCHWFLVHGTESKLTKLGFSIVL